MMFLGLFNNKNPDFFFRCCRKNIVFVDINQRMGVGVLFWDLPENTQKFPKWKETSHFPEISWKDKLGDDLVNKADK